MAFTFITKPAVGDPTKKQAFADAVVDDLTYLYNSLLSAIGSREIISNGSFEADTDADGIPDGWTKTLFAGSSTFSHEQSTVAADGKSIHGKRAVKFTSIGGGGSGGGYVQSTDFFEVSESRFYLMSFQHKSSVAGIRNKAEIIWYDSTQVTISTTTLYDSAANPTAWTIFAIACKGPANARYAKLKFTGADSSNTVAGSAWFDDVRFGALDFQNRAEFRTAGTGSWVCPAGVYFVEARVVGAGGAAGSTNAGASAGGGAGGEAYVITAVVPGTIYALFVGSGGTTVANNTGNTGTASTLTIGATTYTGNPGAGGNAAGTVGGAGGTATNGTINTTGAQGGIAAGTTGGPGGPATLWGMAAPGGLNNFNGNPGPQPGGGGSGNGAGAGITGGIGGLGIVVIRW